MKLSSPVGASLRLAVLALAATVRALAMSVIAPDFTELVSKAEVVARVEVTAQSSRWDVSASGQKVIHTYVECRVLKQLKGAPQAALSLRFLGGQVGASVMQIPDMPTFVTGERYVVFVAGNGRAFCPLVGVMHGKYSLAAASDGIEHVRRSNGAPLHSTAEVRTADEAAPSSADNGMTRDEFEQAIAAEVAHAAAR